MEKQYRYAPRGVPESATGSATFNPFRFAGAWFDTPNVWLIYLRNRYYDPVLRRFISEDPIGLAGGINPYVYAGNDPVNRTDRFGLAADCLTSGVATYEWDAFKEWDLLSIRTTGTMCLDAGGGGGGGGGGAHGTTHAPASQEATAAAAPGDCLDALGRFAVAVAVDGLMIASGGLGWIARASAAGWRGGRAAFSAARLAVGGRDVGATIVGTASVGRLRTAQTFSATAAAPVTSATLTRRDIGGMELGVGRAPWLTLAEKVPLLGSLVTLGESVWFCTAAALGADGG